MSLEERTQWAARPTCDRCGWRGDWHTSRTSQAAATERATNRLAFHSDFWHTKASS